MKLHTILLEGACLMLFFVTLVITISYIFA